MRNTRIPPRSPSLGFSLVEVTLSLGIVSFAMMTLLSLLPVGLSNVHRAAVQTGEASIAKRMSSELQQIPLSEIKSLHHQTHYYDEQGNLLDSGTNAYFSAGFEILDPSIPGASTLDYTAVARTVKVTIRYPQNAPLSAQQISVFSLLAAEQTKR